MDTPSRSADRGWSLWGRSLWVRAGWNAKEETSPTPEQPPIQPHQGKESYECSLFMKIIFTFYIFLYTIISIQLFLYSL